MARKELKFVAKRRQAALINDLCPAFFVLFLLALTILVSVAQYL